MDCADELFAQKTQVKNGDIEMIAFLLFIGCGEKSTDTGTDSDSPNINGTQDSADSATPTLECTERSVETCLEDEACTYLSGFPLQDDGNGGSCVDWSIEAEPQGCIAIETACPPSIEFAAPAADSGDCWAFTSGCIPEGWVSCAFADECPRD